MPKRPAHYCDRRTAQRTLLDIATEAIEADPRLVNFVEALWHHAKQRSRHLDRLGLPSKTMRRLGRGADTKIDGTRHGYQFFRDWLLRRSHRGSPILTLLTQGCAGEEEDGKGLVAEYRVNLPLCDGDPWPAVREALPPPIPSAKLQLAQVEAIRLAVLRTAFRSVRCDRETRQRRLLQTARMAAYHSLAPSSREKRSLCPLWPNERGVDLAVFDHDDECVPSLTLLVATGREAKQLLPFERVALRDAATERVCLSLWTPSHPLKLKARSLDVNVIQVRGLIDAAPPKGLEAKRPRRR